MKTIKNILLLVALLCLAGCSGEDQYVSFSVHEIDVNNEAHRLSIVIEANCSWIVTDEKDKTYTETKSGKGTMEVPLVIFYNPDYESKEYTVTVTSEDGTSTDVLTVKQEAKKGLEIETVDIVSEEGGTFTVPVNTNDEITKVETPDWMTFVSSRGLTGYTYTFTAEPNKTGAVRKASVNFIGKNITKAVEVTQNSYAPTEIVLGEDLIAVTGNKFSTSVSVVPEYSDPSKLEITVSDGCTAYIENGILTVETKGYGEYEISLSSLGKTLLHRSFESLPRYPFYPDPMEAYRGQEYIPVGWNYYSPLYELKSTNSSVVRVVDNKRFEAVGTGTAVISAGLPGTDVYVEKKVTVEPFTIKAQIGWVGEQWDGSFDVKFAARIEGPYGMKYTGFLVTDKNGKVITSNSGAVSSIGHNIIIISSGAVNIKYNRSQYDNINDALTGYIFLASANIDGKAYQRIVKINTKVTGPL